MTLISFQNYFYFAILSSVLSLNHLSLFKEFVQEMLLFSYYISLKYYSDPFNLWIFTTLFGIDCIVSLLFFILWMLTTECSVDQE